MVELVLEYSGSMAIRKAGKELRVIQQLEPMRVGVDLDSGSRNCSRRPLVNTTAQGCKKWLIDKQPMHMSIEIEI
jgi:hypothetical protein